MAASLLAWRARLKPMNSRCVPRCTTSASIRERRRAVDVRTSTSRHEQHSASMTPRTATAGTVRYCGCAIRRLREDAHIVDEVHNRRAGGDHVAHVVVSRNGLSTSDSSPHSTPMDAQFTVPSRATVVTIVSMITVQSVCLGIKRHAIGISGRAPGFALFERG